jgi:hypothetical protein
MAWTRHLAEGIHNSYSNLSPLVFRWRRITGKAAARRLLEQALTITYWPDLRLHGWKDWAPMHRGEALGI